MAGSIAATLASSFESVCLESCPVANETRQTCRSGYVCSSLAARATPATAAFFTSAPAKAPFCQPPATLLDAGVRRDGG
jgi:hypothetical protein